jgi:hypothetical protein
MITLFNRFLLSNFYKVIMLGYEDSMVTSYPEIQVIIHKIVLSYSLSDKDIPDRNHKTCKTRCNNELVNKIENFKN